MKNTSLKIALLTIICFILSLVLVNMGEEMSNRGIIFIGLISLSASTIIIAFFIGDAIVSKFKK